MKYSELVECGATEARRQDFLAEGEQTPITLRVPKNLKDAAELDSLGWIKVIDTPGHTPGGVCYHFVDDNILFSGDTLFAGSVGRTDMPGGDMTVLMRSLKALAELPDDTTVVPGHGPATTIGREKASSPFLKALSRYQA